MAGSPKKRARREAAAAEPAADAAAPCTCGGRYVSHDPLRADAQYSRALADEILDRHASGETLRAICRTPGYPSDRTVRRWSYNDLDGFKARLHEAGRQFCSSLDEECLEIADSREGDWVWNHKSEKLDFCHEAVQRSRVRVETRQKCIARAWPERFSDRYSVSTEITGKDGAPLIPEVTDKRDLARAIFSILREARIDGGQTVDATPLGAFAAAAAGTPKALFGNPPGISDAEIVTDEPAADEAETDVDFADMAPGDLADTPHGLSLEFITASSDGNSRWYVLDGQGQRIAPVWGIEQARAMSRQLAETGQITRGARPEPPAKPASAPRGPIIDITAERPPQPPQPRAIGSH